MSISERQDLKERLTRVLVEEIAPALAMDDGSIEVIDVANGVARVRLTNACGSCPSTIMALVMGIEQELRQRLPEIEYLEAVP